MSDIYSVALAGVAVGLYVITFLGSFSPMHCRCMLALAGVASAILSFFAGLGLLYICGLHSSSFHSWLPFLVMSIGVEHMFVICTAVDRTDLQSSSYHRVHEALSHAGPAITITSLTTCVAFLSGTLSSLQALRSFCLFAAVTTAMLYANNMTIFMAVVVWDTQRVQKRQKECFGLFCCKENSKLCCKGKLASPKQRDFTGNVKFKIADSTKVKHPNYSMEVETALRAIRKNSHSERCCGILMAPLLLKNVHRGLLLTIYLLLVSAASYGVS